MHQDNRIFIKKERPASHILVLAALIVLAGGWMVIRSNWIIWQLLIGMGFMFLGLSLLFLKTQIYFIPQENSLITYWKTLFAGRKQVEKLPEIAYIAVVQVKILRQMNYKSISYADKEKKCNLNLIYQNSPKRFKKIHTLEKENALQLAKEIAQSLNIPVLDGTGVQKQWLR